MKHILLLIISVVFLSACSNGRKHNATMQRGGGVGDVPQDREHVLTDTSTVNGCYYGSGELPGTVWIQDSSMDGQFQDDVYDLATAKGDPDGTGENGLSLGNVSGVCGASTGVRFSGKVNVEGGFRQGQPGRVQSAAEFILVIFDHYAVESENSENRIPGIGFYAPRAYGQVNSDGATVEMSWEGGVITLEGWFDGEDFLGTIHYKNSKHFAGQSPAQGSLGKFIVPTCSFFNCQ
ncbi:MAG: hypothetical protein MK008_02440 [Bdellovibrionales bacterium]|nr:hypothetical protein [Bdellovibrionales bacterium]